jgi:hypothetical protein
MSSVLIFVNLRPAMFDNGSGGGINLGHTRTLPAESF